MQGGLFSCTLPLDAIINGRERRAAQPIRSLLACQPKTNCLLALTAGFYLHNSNPKAKANLHFANSDRRSRVYGWTHAGRSGERVGRGSKKKREKKKTPDRTEPQQNQSRSRVHRARTLFAGPISRTLRGLETLASLQRLGFLIYFFNKRGGGFS